MEEREKRSWLKFRIFVQPDSGYKLVQLRNGSHSLHSLKYRETLHPGLGPAQEAEALYVRQLQLEDRLRQHNEEFVVWDIGLGAAANALTLLRATEKVSCSIRLLSFDYTIEPLQFALEHKTDLEFLNGYETQVEQLVREHHIAFEKGAQKINWNLHLADFPTLLTQSAVRKFPKPHVIMFDAYSPVSNPAMWTLPLFTNLFQLLDPERPCALPTYSRSTILRTTLLLAGFFVGVGHATGQKEETTLAANMLELIAEPLDRRWLERARRSDSAEPLLEPIYSRAPLSQTTWEKLQRHPQFD
jgi:tRNA U34 5-methylaminomethyl-2-thiouridine-forming methyltransferase MnmC